MRIYLDQSHLSNLALGRVSALTADKFRALVSGNKITPVFSMSHIFETWKHQDPEVRKKISGFVDALPRLEWIISRHVLVGKEVEAAFFRCHGVPFDLFKPIKPKLTHVLYEGMKEPIELVVEEYGFSKTLLEIETNSGLSGGYAEWKSLENSFPGVKAVASRAIQVRGRSATFKDFDKLFAQYIADKIPVRYPNGRHVSESEKRKFLDSRHWHVFEKMPATYLFERFDEARARDLTGGTDPSALTDTVHLSALPYVEIFLCDKQTKHYVNCVTLPTEVSGRSFSDIDQALARF